MDEAQQENESGLGKWVKSHPALVTLIYMVFSMAFIILAYGLFQDDHEFHEKRMEHLFFASGIVLAFFSSAPIVLASFLIWKTARSTDDVIHEVNRHLKQSRDRDVLRFFQSDLDKALTSYHEIAAAIGQLAIQFISLAGLISEVSAPGNKTDTKNANGNEESGFASTETKSKVDARLKFESKVDAFLKFEPRFEKITEKGLNRILRALNSAATNEISCALWKNEELSLPSTSELILLNKAKMLRLFSKIREGLKSGTINEGNLSIAITGLIRLLETPFFFLDKFTERSFTSDHIKGLPSYDGLKLYIEDYLKRHGDVGSDKKIEVLLEQIGTLNRMKKVEEAQKAKNGDNPKLNFWFGDLVAAEIRSQMKVAKKTTADRNG